MLNKDQETRDKILGLLPGSYYAGGTERVRQITLVQLEELIKNNFISLDDQQNSAPTVNEFYEFMKDHPEFTAHGYAVDKRRDDYRVSIEGIQFYGPSGMTAMLDFIKLCRYADEFVCTPHKLYAWWD